MFSGDLSCPERMRVARTCVKPVSLPFHSNFPQQLTGRSFFSFLLYLTVQFVHLCTVSLVGSGEVSDEASREHSFPGIRVSGRKT